jgi:poly-gamma-glutamate synthesis protein (capsule biosynthesis protein)
MMLVPASVLHAEDAWPWSGSFGSGSVNILLVGDINIEQRSDPAAAFTHVIATLHRADLVYGNLEGLLVPSLGPDQDIPDKSGWQHIGPEAVKALKAGNIQVVGVANNVAYGPANILKSLAVLDANGIQHTGGGKNLEEAHRPAIVKRKGVRIGFLQYTAKWYLSDQQLATAASAGVAKIFSPDGKSIDASDLQRLQDDIRKLRPLVDILVVSSHNRDGGNRVAAAAGSDRAAAAADPKTLVAPIVLGPQFSQGEPYERELAHAAIDAGADIVYGHGSHVLQGVEVYRDKPVMYCLGNFATDWIRMRPNKDGLVARVVLEGKTVKRVSLVPVTRDVPGNNVTMLDPSGGEGAKLLQKVKDLSTGTPLRIDGREAILVGK